MTFNEAFARLMPIEGGYVNNPFDPGGETKFGISKRAYPDLDIKALTHADASAIYRRDFWDRIEAGKMPGSVAFQVFDFAVNSGIETAVRYYQRAIGVADDGHFGPVSLTAATRVSESDQIMRLNAERLDFMTRLDKWPTFGKGWARRIATNLRYGADDSD